METTFSYDHYWQYGELKSSFEFFAEKYPDFSAGNRGCSVRPVCMAGAAWYLRKKDEKDQNQD